MKTTRNVIQNSAVVLMQCSLLFWSQQASALGRAEVGNAGTNDSTMLGWLPGSHSDKRDKEKKQQEAIQTLPEEYQKAIQELLSNANEQSYWIDNASTKQTEGRGHQVDTDVALHSVSTENPPWPGTITHHFWVVVNRQYQVSDKAGKKAPKQKELSADELYWMLSDMPAPLGPAVQSSVKAGFKAYKLESSSGGYGETRQILLRRDATIANDESGKSQSYETDEIIVYFNHNVVSRH